MFERRRIRRAHARFLRASRSLRDARERADASAGWARGFLDWLLPAPLLAVEGEGRALQLALDWLEENCRRTMLSEETIRHYHRTALDGRLSRPGAYRTEPVTLVGSPDQPPPAARVGALMKQLDRDLAEAQRALDERREADREEVLRTALELYRKLGWIHPFPDGNGRVGRLAMNHLLRRYGAGYVVLPAISDAPDLLDALTRAHRGDFEALVRAARANWVFV